MLVTMMPADAALNFCNLFGSLAGAVGLLCQYDNGFLTACPQEKYKLNRRLIIYAGPWQKIEGRGMNVRWDAVVDRTAAGGIDKTPPPLPWSTSNQRTDCIQVHVQLFGALASVSAERSIRLQLPTTTTVADVLAILGERLGDSFLARVLTKTGAKHYHCRLFVDGYPVEDLQASLNVASEPTHIEIILLIAPEGG